MVRLEDLADQRQALSWFEALQTALASLTSMPERCPLAPEASRFTGVWQGAHQFLFRRRADGPAWRVLFVIEAPEEEAPTVRVLMLWHGARRPITRDEARQALEDS